jgi:hypothetical protein
MVHYRRGDKSKHPSAQKYANVSNLIKEVRKVVPNNSVIVFATDERDPANLKILETEKIPTVSSLLSAASVSLNSIEEVMFTVQLFIWADEVVVVKFASTLDNMIEDGRRASNKKVIWIT